VERALRARPYWLSVLRALFLLGIWPAFSDIGYMPRAAAIDAGSVSELAGLRGFEPPNVKGAVKDALVKIYGLVT
jgi:hypothetical protein